MSVVKAPIRAYGDFGLGSQAVLPNGDALSHIGPTADFFRMVVVERASMPAPVRFAETAGLALDRWRPRADLVDFFADGDLSHTLEAVEVDPEDLSRYFSGVDRGILLPVLHDEDASTALCRAIETGRCHGWDDEEFVLMAGVFEALVSEAIDLGLSREAFTQVDPAGSDVLYEESGPLAFETYILRDITHFLQKMFEFGFDHEDILTIVQEASRICSNGAVIFHMVLSAASTVSRRKSFDPSDVDKMVRRLQVLEGRSAKASMHKEIGFHSDYMTVLPL